VRCQICGAAAADTFRDKKSKMLYYTCSACEYIFKSPEYYQSIEEQKARYDLHENNENDPGYEAYFKRFLDFVLPLVGKPSTALDFGCGRSSLLAKLLGRKGIECDYYDPLYHPENLNDSKKYELIVSTEVFEHLHHPKKVFEGLLARLENGGYLAIQTQFHPNDTEAFQKWYYHKDPTHIVFFRAKTFSVLAKQYGCKFVGDNGKNMVVIQK
jgi:hypothetical protein